MSAELRIVVGGEDLADEGRVRVARELRSWITEHVPDARVEEPQAGPPKPGHKGVEIAAGTLALFITSGAAKALIECVATYIRERRRSVTLEVSAASGEKVTLAAQNIGKGELDRLVTQLGAMSQTPPSPSPAS